MRFCVRVADYQRSKGRYFYFEHPLTARSWQSVDELWELMGRDDVEAVTVHMCQFELQATDSEGIGFVKKPTRILTNLPPLASALNRQCQGGHRHVHLMSGRAKGAAAYTKEFCMAICQALAVCLEYLGEVQSGASFYG